MELIVKIGADQAGLQQSVARMKAQFASANLSTPVSWGGQAEAMRRYGGILSPPEESGGLAEYATHSFVQKSTKLLKGMLFHEIANTAAEVLKIWGEKFWEHVYGVSEEQITRIKQQHEAVRKAIVPTLQAREREPGEIHARLLRELSPESKAELLEKDRTEAYKARERARKELENAKADLAEATDTRGRPIEMSNPGRAVLVGQIAQAEAKFLAANKTLRDTEDAHRAALADLPLKEKKKPEEPKEFHANRFEADALAEAGLFTRTSLLYNPNFNVQQQQLEVLRQIETNQHAGGFRP